MMAPSSKDSKSEFYYVYISESAEESDLYIGFTNNLRKRIREHNSGKSNFTRNRDFWKLIYYEACLNKKDAKRREEYLKKTQGRRMLKLRIKEYLKEK